MLPTSVKEPILVNGVELEQLPENLFIPPDALRVILESFSGPMDLLVYLIRKQNIDLLTLDIAQLCNQYIEYVELMRAARIDLAAEYLSMAAILLEMKSRLLLPRREDSEDEQEEDPRAALLKQVLEYERMRKAAELLFDLPQADLDYFVAYVEPVSTALERVAPKVTTAELFAAAQRVFLRARNYRSHSVQPQRLSVDERMRELMSRLTASAKPVAFGALFDLEEGRIGVVVSFIAILELARARKVLLVQMAETIYLSLELENEGEFDGS